MLAALAQSTRLEAFRLLARSEPEGLAAGALAEMLGVPQNTLSSHLAILSAAGLAHAQRQGRSQIYRANLAAVRELVVYLLNDCCQGRPQLCGEVTAAIATCCPCEPAKPTPETIHPSGARSVQL